MFAEPADVVTLFQTAGVAPEAEGFSGAAVRALPRLETAALAGNREPR